MVGWHHRLNGHESEQTLGDREGQGSLVCRSPWGGKESDTTGQLKANSDDSPTEPWHTVVHSRLWGFVHTFYVTSRQRH